MAIQLPAYNSNDWGEWRKDLIRMIGRYHNAAYFCARGRYVLSTHSSQLNEKVQGWVDAFSNKATMYIEEKEIPGSKVGDYFLSIPEVAEILNCSRETVYKKHIPAGLKTIKPTGSYQKVLHSDLQEYIQTIRTKAA